MGQMNNAITEDTANILLNYLMVSSQNLKTENGKQIFIFQLEKEEQGITMV